MAFDESFSEAWQLRYGSGISNEVPDLAPFLRHRSVRKYSDKPVPESLIAALMGCAQSASTSSNLQLWTVVSVQEPERRQKIAALCADQAQVHRAPWFLCFVADHYRIREAADQQGEQCEGLDYTEFMLMACMDAALASERMVCAAESLGLGACYIGALRNHVAEVSELLNLPSGAFGVFGLCLGYPSESETSGIKPRLGHEQVWHRETYNHEVNVADYDERMAEFYAAQQMSTSTTWTQKSARRLDGQHMTGREVLKEWLKRNGMGVR
jgi:nitroreductase